MIFLAFRATIKNFLLLKAFLNRFMLALKHRHNFRANKYFYDSTSYIFFYRSLIGASMPCNSLQIVRSLSRINFISHKFQFRHAFCSHRRISSHHHIYSGNSIDTSFSAFTPSPFFCFSRDSFLFLALCIFVQRL